MKKKYQRALIIIVGLITASEMMYAGGTHAINTSYYLYNRQYYWTMSPHNSIPTAAFNISGTGGHGGATVDNDAYGGLRPVINLKANTTLILMEMVL